MGKNDLTGGAFAVKVQGGVVVLLEAVEKMAFIGETPFFSEFI